MNVFITGATGYIGFSVARAFSQAGYNVFGLTRNSKKADMLWQNEIHPVMGNMAEPESYKEIAKTCGMLIHAAADYENDMVALDKKTVETFIELGRQDSGEKTLIYTSGCWVNGNTNGEIDESVPLNPAGAVVWRPAVEQTVLNSDDVRGLVIRPGCVYGKGGGLTGMWFGPASAGMEITVTGNGKNHWSMIHVDDLADSYLKLARSKLKSEVFNISDDSRHLVSEMVEEIAGITGNKAGIKYVPVEVAEKNLGPMAEALALDQQITNGKARKLLGWEPANRSFINGIDVYYNSWKSFQAGK